MIGTVVDQYKIVARIAAGGMGEVYRAVDLELERDVAIKCVRPEISELDEATKRFRAEARTLARLSHLNIATVYRFFAEGERLFLVMEFIDGKPFGDIILGMGSIPHDQAVRLVQDALKGLGYAHKNNIVHRDIKPGNLMVDSEDTVKVLDFGIAHLVGGTRLTRVGSVVGTPAYMAPEQILGKDIDQRTDLYSIGVVLYEMLSGKLPYAANSDFELMRAHLEDVPRPMSELSKNHVPMALQKTVERALSKDTAERFQTADEFVQALDNTEGDRTVLLPASLASGAAAATVPQPDAALASEPRNRTTTQALVLGGVAAMVLAVVAVFVLLQDQPGTPATQQAQDPPATNAPIGVGNNATQPDTPINTAQGDPTVQTVQSAPIAATTSTQPAAEPAPQSSPTTIPSEPPREIAPTSNPPARPVQQAVRSAPPPASRPIAAKPPSRVVVVKISVHEKQGTGRFSRDAGYNGSFRLSVPVGADRNLDVSEFVEVYRDGELVREVTVAEEVRTPGTFKAKRRIPGLKTLDPGLYDVNLMFQHNGRTLGKHAWKLTVSG